MSDMLFTQDSCRECYGTGKYAYTHPPAKHAQDCYECQGTGLRLTALGREVVQLIDEVAKIRAEKGRQP